jgi:hypothetical protein
VGGALNTQLFRSVSQRIQVGMLWDAEKLKIFEIFADADPPTRFLMDVFEDVSEHPEDLMRLESHLQSNLFSLNVLANDPKLKRANELQSDMRSTRTVSPNAIHSFR